MKKYFLKLYQYNDWANKRVLHAMQTQQVANEKTLTLMSHVLFAQNIWLNRIEGMSTDGIDIWKKMEIDELVSFADQIGKRWLEFVERSDSFDREMTYKNFVGLPFTNNVEQIMIHLVNHSTYHRGQVALLMRQNGFDPVNTDFITYDRVISGQLKA